MADTETQLSLEGLALANLFVTKHVLSTLIARGALTTQAVQLCLNSAKNELHQTTLSITAVEADEIMRLIWRDFMPSAPTEPH